MFKEMSQSLLHCFGNQMEFACVLHWWMDVLDARIDLYIELYLYITYIELVNASWNR